MGVMTQWRKIPNFCDYEVNMAGEVRMAEGQTSVAPYDGNQDLYQLFLANSFTPVLVTGQTLVKDAFPEFFAEE